MPFPLDVNSHLERLAKESGFKSVSEMNRLVSKVDLSTRQKLDAFTQWKAHDGSKDSLLKNLLAEESA